MFSFLSLRSFIKRDAKGGCKSNDLHPRCIYYCIYAPKSLIPLRISATLSDSKWVSMPSFVCSAHNRCIVCVHIQKLIFQTSPFIGHIGAFSDVLTKMVCHNPGKRSELELSDCSSSSRNPDTNHHQLYSRWFQQPLRKWSNVAHLGVNPHVYCVLCL